MLYLDLVIKNNNKNQLITIFKANENCKPLPDSSVLIYVRK